ncbi:hypothetical protein [Roseibacillus persicicus]|uniref:Uncharacterized protein n=1 Tax=Roseibacillus persicicus TaxID=454148 RepID=A0A918WRE9_9BACT|nr:hypothetical protein [Roseibacillus persicicus]GHC67503.1 hypothetical protein GCM10007100_39480 [Roseibacillus persicicus]
MNKALLYPLAAGLALTSCVVEPMPGRSSPLPPPSDNSLPPVPNIAPTVEWAPVNLAGGGQQINIAVNGRDYFLKQGESFEPQAKTEFAGLGVPADAVLAALYWDENAEEESGSKAYAIVEGQNVVVYTGYIAPGEMNNVDWKRFKSIPF